MMALCYRAPKEREENVAQLLAAIGQTTPELARKQAMIGSRNECLDTIERYTKAGITHFIFMLFSPFYLDDLQSFAEEVIPQVR